MSGEPQRGRHSRRRVVLFCWLAACVLAVVTIGAVAGSGAVARSQAQTEAEAVTARTGALVVAPLLAPALAGDQTRRAELDRAVLSRLGDGHLIAVSVWSREGDVLYASDAGQVGQRQSPAAGVLAAIDRRQVTSVFEDPPEAGSGSAGRLHVHVPFDVTGQPPLALVASYDAARFEDATGALTWRVVPLVLLPMLALLLIQLPVVLSLTRRIRRHEVERAELLTYGLGGSERERVRIAGDLHDGPIQDLAGIAYALGAIAPSVPAPHKPLMTTVQVSVLHAVESLRRLMVDLYPPDLDVVRLPVILDGLAVPLRERGISTVVSVDALPDIDRDTVTMLYRVARESLRNVVAHAEASSAALTVTVDRGQQHASRLVLTIDDDGKGIDCQRIDRRAEGHLGLRLLIDRAETLGGQLDLGPRPEGGTRVKLTLPVLGAGAAPPVGVGAVAAAS